MIPSFPGADCAVFYVELTTIMKVIRPTKAKNWDYDKANLLYRATS